jgi:hypothetical protein
MTKKTEQYLVCDICGRKGAETWMVGNPEGERCRVDLCPRCDDPVRKAFVAGRRQVTGPMGHEALELTTDYSPVEKQHVYQWQKANEQRNG